jgi:thiol:disulfide interchange protein DsbD
MSKQLLFGAIFAVISGLCALPAPAAAQEEPRHSNITVLPGDNHIEPGETIMLAVRQQMEDGWHTYWINAGDSGEPMRMEWSLPDGFTVGTAQWPVPHRIVTGPLASYGYEKEALILVPLTAPAQMADGAVSIGLQTTTLVCADICIPETQDTSFTLNTPDAAAHYEVIAQAREHMPVVLEDVRGTFTEADGYLHVNIDARIGDGPVLLPHDWGLIDNMANTEEVEGGVRHKRGDRPLRAVKEARFLLADADGKGVEFVAESTGVQAAAAPVTVENGDASKSVDISLALALLLAFGGGLILNLMPCVFPVLFMKALSLCKLSGKEEGEARVQALLYTAGILVSFAAVAGILMGLRAGGAQIGWGFQLQEPVVIAALSYLFFVIALNLSGYFEISGKFAGAGQGLVEKGGKHGHAFFMGVLATVVATPCTAPFMGAAMGYALVQPAPAAMAVFLMLGLGLAAPYVLLSFIPALRRMLPKPGTWMEVFRRILAVPMFLTVAWLVWVFSMQAGIAPVAALVGGLVAIALVIKGWSRTRGAIGRAALLVLVLAAVGAPVAASHIMSAPALDAHAAGEVAFTPARLDAALAGDRPVFVNMTAAWCITCKVNEKVALAGAATQALFTENKVDYIVGDWTNQDPEISKFLERYGRNGVPLYVFYGKPVNGQRPEPVVLPQLLTPGIIAKTIKGEN